ncbi:MAG: VTT domain-containing protein [Flavobacteriales bacterium]
MKRAKTFLRIVWIALILIGLMLFFLYPNSFTKEALSDFIQKQSSHILLAYAFVSIVRGVFLLPSTPFVLAGILLFPSQPFLVFSISLMGILITSTYLYFGSRFLEFDKIFGLKQSGKANKIIDKLNQHGFWIVLGWAFFPAVPTDLICYLAGTIRMNFAKYILALLIGEGILIGIYVSLGEHLFQ